MKIYIKHMVCDRCKMSITSLLKSLGLAPRSVELGEVDFGDTAPTQAQLATLREKLRPLGFEMIDDKKSQLIAGIKKAIIELVHQAAETNSLKTSDYLSKKLHYDYNYLSNLFSVIEGITIEQYLINQKIERAKELLVYDEMTLTEIALRLEYSSVAHLSRQFKKVTGLTPSYFRQLRDAKSRQSLDKV